MKTYEAYDQEVEEKIKEFARYKEEVGYVDPSNHRNALCPCGSGRKLKRCHGSADKHNAIQNAAAFCQHEIYLIRAEQRKNYPKSDKPMRGMSAMMLASILSIGNRM